MSHFQTNKILVGLIALQAIAIAFISLMLLPLVAQWHALDLSLYFNDGRKIMQGSVPYRDFSIEYPPLAVLPFVLPHLVALRHPAHFIDYVQGFLLENIVFSTAIALALACATERYLIGRPARLTLALYALFAALSAPLLPWRYDLFPALLTMLAFVCVLGRRPAWAGIWVGLGVAAKLYPLVLLPIFGMYYLAGRQYRALLRLVVGSAMAVLLTLLPFLFAFTTPAELLAFLGYHSLRGLQVESLPAGVIVLAHAFGLVQAKLEFNFGALHVVSPWSAPALGWLPLFLVLVFGAVALCAWGRFREEAAAANSRLPAAETLAAYVLAVLLAFIVTNKVFSPQYIIWLLPFAPLLRPRQALLFLAIVAMTIALFPFDYDKLLEMQRAPVVVLNLRNLLVLVLLGWLVIEHAPTSARSLLPWRELSRVY